MSDVAEQQAEIPVENAVQPVRWDANKKAEVAPSSNAWKLRWRQPRVADVEVQPARPDRAVQQASAVSGPKATLAWSDGSSESKYQVRQAAQFTPVDPFDNPFGDKKNAARSSLSDGTVEVAQPLNTNPNSGNFDPGSFNQGNLNQRNLNQGALQPPADPFEFPPDSPEPSDSPLPNRTTPRSDDTFPFPDEARPLPAEPMTPPPTDAAPTPPSDAFPGFPPLDQNGALGQRDCDRIYNLRNCCVDGENCQESRNKVRNDKITNISLDITPVFTNTDPIVTTDVVMARTLAEAPSRIWRDRQGNQLAEGRFTDFRHGRIHVTTADGEVVKVPYQSLSDDDLCFVTAWWSLPYECTLDQEEYVPREWIASNLSWKASALCHKPLYFEERALERYGHTAGPIKQPIISTAHFFGSLVTLPYQMGINPPQECQYVLGLYRPGSCAPWLIPPMPISLRGGLAEAGAIVGGIYVIP